jgi:hypothetical protein
VNRNLHRIFDALLSGSPTEWIVFVVVLATIAVATWAVLRYRASLRDDADPAADDALLVHRVRELRDSGDVSDSEYRSVKSRLRPLAGDTSVGGATGLGERGGPPPRPGTAPDRAPSQASRGKAQDGIDPKTHPAR